MHFKRLELQGFKSFVDATTLDFEAGVTAIIGPNGCGKSNIVDSIRWVLGEQSAKSLRGARMEDVIFNGTENRKAVGMSEVSLTIDNHDKLLKTEHDEITITRRAFRSGDSEYLMNKVPCRLRDIHDLFMDTGIGTSSYSILEQGKIDLIVSSKPADRRMVFEEAAGISKYKARKEESLRKLEATEQNYLRVNDIVVEVRRQIGSLERQVQKARRYQACKQELTTLEVSQGKKELREKRRALRKIEQEWESRQSLLQESETERKKLEGELTGLASELESADSNLNQMREKLHQLVEDAIKADDFIASTELRKTDLAIGIERMNAEISALQSKERQLREQNAGTLEAREHKETELKICSSELAGAEERLNQLEQELKERAVRVQDQQNRLLEIVDQMSTLRGTLKNLEIRQSEQEQRLSKLNLQLQALNEQREEVLLEQTKQTSDAQSIAQNLKILETEQAQLTQEKEHLENVQKTLSAMLENFSKTITQLSSRLTWIEELKNGLDGYEQGTKTILLEKNAHPEQYSGVIGPVVNFIRTDQKFEFALEAWLEHKLQYILVHRRADADQLVEFLQNGNRGRATFIPCDEQALPENVVSRPVAAEPWLSLPGVFGWASDLARMDERFRGVFGQLLSQVAIVQDMATANAVRQSGARCTLVTLGGEILSAADWLTGGSQDLMEKGLLGREREIEELKAELEVLQMNFEKTQQESEQTTLKLVETNGSLFAVSTERHEMEIKSAQIEKSLESLRAQGQDLDKQLVEIQQERSQVMAVLAQIVSDHQAAAQKLLDLELTDRQTQAELSNHQEEIEVRRKEYDERSLRAGELRVQSAALEQQLNNLNAETSRVTHELDEISFQTSEKLAACKRDQERLQDMDYQIREKQALSARLAESRLAQEQHTEELKSRRESLAAHKQEKESGMRQAQEMLDFLRQELHHQELEKSEQKMNLKTLENYLEQEYKLNLTFDADDVAEENLSAADEAPADMSERIRELKEKIAAIGTVNLVAMEEYDELEQRSEFLNKQINDLKEAKENLQRLITRINQESRERFADTFGQVREKFKEVFRRLFNGGEADLILVDESNLLETGIEIIARPPGKRPQNISLLSGGEKALTAIALLFAIFLVKPSPFCIFDEMDAPLDDTNTARFSRILKEFADKSQFIVITHNKVTMEAAGVLYGVTMQESGVSSLVSVKFKGEGKDRSLQPVTSMTEEVSLN